MNVKYFCTKKLFFAVAISFILSACGGGGGNGNPSSTNALGTSSINSLLSSAGISAAVTSSKSVASSLTLNSSVKSSVLASSTNSVSSRPASSSLASSRSSQTSSLPAVANCGGLAGEGVFEEITPPVVKATMAATQDGGGTFAIAVDPVNSGTIYVGTLYQKMWKSADCGATWTNISTGRNGADVGSGMNWTFAVDPVDAQVVYTNSGYSQGVSGLYKSVNGGSDWDLIWPPATQPELGDVIEYNFANVIAIDPADHLHLLLTFHAICKPPHAGTCIAESFNAGSTWRLIDGEPSWDGREGQVIFFLGDSRTWLWGSQTNGFWLSANSGSSWEQIPGMTTSHLQGSNLVQASDGTFYVAGSDGIWRSPNGLSNDWKIVPNTGPIVGGIVTDGTSLFASTHYFTNWGQPRYLRSAVTNGLTWTAMPNIPAMSQGGNMAYDKGNRLLYTANLTAGLWRVVVH